MRPVTVGERRRQIEQILLITSAIPPEPPSGIPFSSIKILSITVLMFSVMLTLEAAVAKNIPFYEPTSNGYKWNFIVDQINWMYSVNMCISLVLVVGTFLRNHILVLIWILYAVGAGVIVGITVSMKIINGTADNQDIIALGSTLVLTVALRMFWKFFKEIHEDSQPDTEWDFLSNPVYQETLAYASKKNKKISAPPPPIVNSMA